jgi:acid phosphatase type 7
MKTIRGKFRTAMLMGAAASMLAFTAGAKAQNQNSNDDHDQWSNGNWAPNDNPWPYEKLHRSPVLAVVGDISCQPDADLEATEAGHETCGTPKAPYTSTSLLQSQAATAQQIENMKPNLVAIVGDEQYQVGQYQDFEQSYESTYGAFKLITRPSPGNHEFYVEHGAVGVAGYGYFSYFNGVQHNADGSVMTATIANNPDTGGTFTQPVPFSDGQAGHFEQTGGLGNTIPAGGSVGVGDGWYSYNLGTWHLISLNIQCETQPGGCSTTGSWFASELEWLKKDLKENHSACTVAYWHQPTFSAADSLSLEGTTAQAFWQLLYENGADLVLNGHDHLYARYRPLDPSGNFDPRKGLREFIVGTGGETLDTVVSSATGDAGAQFNAANLEASSGNYWGVMALTLDENGYKWDFESALELPGAPAGTYSDKGAAACHGSDNR